MPISKLFIVLGATMTMLGVILGAFGAHALKSRIPADLMTVFQTGVQYHFYHALGLIMIGIIAFHLPQSGLLKWSGWTMFAGIILFSGSLYVLALTNIKWLGAITPLGGTAFIISWLLVIVAVIKN